MTLRFEEKPGSGNMTDNPPSLEKLYYCAGSASEGLVMNLARSATAAQVSTPMGILYRQAVTLDWEGADFCNITVTYGPTNTSEVGSYSISFSAVGGTVHITNSLQSIARYGEAGLNDAPDMKGALDYDGEEVRGTDKISPQCKMTVAFSHPQGVFSMDRCRQLARHVAYVNSDNFFGFAPGEVLFAAFDGSVGSEQDTTIQYEYLLQENAEGLAFGDVDGVDKKGWHYLWIRYMDDEDADLPVRIPQHVYVERIYEETGYNALFGFGS